MRGGPVEWASLPNTPADRPTPPTALTSTSVEGAYKRSVVMAWIISFGNINGAATTNVYLCVATMLCGDEAHC